MTAEYRQGDEPLIPMPALSLPALRQAVAVVAEHEAWKAAGRPGLKSHEEFMAEVFGGSR